MTYHLTTYGCQMNTSDSERIAALLEQNLRLKPAAKESADVLIFNLCSVRESAVNRIWGNLKQIKSKCQPLIIFTGCILPTDRQKIKAKNCLILDIKDLAHWPEIIKKQFNNLTIKQLNNLTIKQSAIKDYLAITPKYSTPFTAYVPIMTGCNNFCSYCAVPYTRGREYSRPVKDILTEVSTLTKKGYKEIILLGQNVNSYAANFPSSLRRGGPITIGPGWCNFPALLNLIDQIPGKFWLTFFTSHPKDLSSELIHCFKNSRHLIPYLHLALQSGSDKILTAMNRRYTARHFSDLISKVRRVNPDICISTDIIVGFPGETKKDFRATAQIMEKLKFDMAYLSAYSPRPGTAAAKLKDNVSKSEKEKRKNDLNEILKTTALTNNQKLIGQTIEALVESSQNNSLFGRTKNFKNVKIITTNNQQLSINNKKTIGQFVKIKITKTTPWNLEGILIK